MEHKTKFKDLSFKGKIDYIWDYYKIPITAVILILIFIVSFIHEKQSQKDSVLDVLCVNSQSDADTTDVMNKFLSDNGYDTSKSQITLNQNIMLDINNSTDYSQIAALTAYYNAGEYDISIQDKDTFDHFAPGGVYADLRDYLSDDILEKYKDSILYISDENSSEKYPCGISLSSDNCTLLQKTNLYDSCILSICHTDSDKKLVKSFCKYILL